MISVNETMGAGAGSGKLQYGALPRARLAQIKPTTNTRIDLGLALGDTKPTGRLIDTGGFQKKDRITHRIPITSLAEIDDDLKHWMQIAYERET